MKRKTIMLLALVGTFTLGACINPPSAYTNAKDCIAAGYEWEVDSDAPNGECETD